VLLDAKKFSSLKCEQIVVVTANAQFIRLRALTSLRFGIADDVLRQYRETVPDSRDN